MLVTDLLLKACEPTTLHRRDLSVPMSLLVDQDFFAGLPDPHILTDENWRVLFLNPPAEKLFQTCAQEEADRVLWKLSPDPDFEQQHRRALAAGDDLPVISLPFDGVLSWFEVHISLTSFGAVVQYRDISAQRQLAEMHNKYSAVIDSADDAIIT